MSQDIDITTLRLSLYAPYEDLDELITKFEKLEDISVPEEYKNVIIDIDKINPRDSSLIFTDRPLRRVEESTGNRLMITSSDDEFFILMEFDRQLVSDMETILSEFGSILSDIEIRSFRMDATIPVSFDELDLPLDHDSGLDVSGIRIKNNGRYYIMQQAEQGTEATIGLDDPFTLEPEAEELDKIIEAQIQEATTFLNNLRK